MAATAGGFDHILCPIDFSKHSRTALRVAAELASRGGGRVTALYVSDPLLDAAAAAAAYDTRALKAQAQKELQQFVRRARLSPDVRVECTMAPGAAGATITAFAERHAATMIVMGSHGLTGPHKWLLGSVAEQVLRKTAVPVLLVPQRMPRGKALERWPGTTAVIGVDLAETGASAVKVLRATVRQFGIRPTFVHVLRPVAFPSWLGSRHIRRAESTRAQSAIRALADKVAMKADCRLLWGDPADEIAAAAANVGTGLVILTLRRGPRFTGPRRGSITYRVAARGATAVLAVP